MNANFRLSAMKIATPVAVVIAFVLLSACSAGGSKSRADEPLSPSVQPSATPSEGGAPPSAAPSAQPSLPAARPTRTGDTAAPAPPTNPTPDPQQPLDLAGAPATLTGTVTTAGNCRILNTGSQRWALLGDKANQLRDGSRVTVRGRPVAVPAGCGAVRALQVALVM